MPRRLALRLLIAWLAGIPMVSAQGPGPQGYPGPGFHGMASGNPDCRQSVPNGYQFQPTLYEQLIPTSRASAFDTDPIEDLGIAETLSHTWFRTEYLWLNYKDARKQFLGAAPLVIPPQTFDPEAFFPAVNREGARIFQQGYLAFLDGAQNRDNSGLRLTMGVPTELFTFEASAFAMGESVSNLRFPTFINVNSILGSTAYPAIPLLRDGLPSVQEAILFDQGLNVKLSSNLQGADARFVMGALTPNAATEVQPILGFNYIHYGNQMLIRGEDVTSNTVPRIESRSNNNIFGPELGLRMETRSRWVTLGFEPKFTFGVNRMSNRVNTSQIFTSAIDPVTLLPIEPDRGEKGTQTRFSPVLDLSTYARIRFSENVNLSIGYQFMALAGMSLAEENVVYNASSVLAAPPLIALKQTRQEFWTHGINVGLNFQF